MADHGITLEPRVHIRKKRNGCQSAPLFPLVFGYLSANYFMQYDTVTEALKGLKQQGFTTDFNIAFDNIQCSSTGKCLYPGQFEIVEHHRFEGNSDPADEAVVYAIKEINGDLKGVLVSAYGMYSDNISEDMIRKLSINE